MVRVAAATSSVSASACRDLAKLAFVRLRAAASLIGGDNDHDGDTSAVRCEEEE